MKIIENKATGQRFEIADGALYPKAAYREIKPEQKVEQPKVDPKPFIETPIEPESQRPDEPIEEEKPKKAKKSKKRKSSKKSKSKKTTE